MTDRDHSRATPQEKIELEAIVGKHSEFWQPPDPVLLKKPKIDETLEKIVKAEEQVKALRYNEGKLDWSLFPFDAAEEIVKVLEFGAKKYAGWNFTNGTGLSWVSTAKSLMRHLFAWMKGEDKDPESGLSHLGHIGCNVLFLLYYEKYKDKYGVSDDRFKR